MPKWILHFICAFVLSALALPALAEKLVEINLPREQLEE